MSWLIFGCGAALGQSVENIDSANQVMPWCRSFIGSEPGDPRNAGMCIGAVRAIVIIEAAEGTICPPSGSSGGQWVRVVVQYIDNRPGRLHENFAILAREALRAAWPCKNSN